MSTADSVFEYSDLVNDDNIKKYFNLAANPINNVLEEFLNLC